MDDMASFLVGVAREEVRPGRERITCLLGASPVKK
jgi:hypothetical protein